MNANSNAPKVFISYSHDSDPHCDHILELANRLRENGVDCKIDQYEPFPEEGWPRWMENQLEWADFVLVVCTPIYYRRFRGKEEPGKGLGVTWEGAIITHELYRSSTKNTKFIPILNPPNNKTSIPSILQGSSHYQVDNQESYESLCRLLTAQPLVKKPPLGKMQEFPTREITLPALPSREQIQHFQPIIPNFFAYDDEAWVGRDELLQDLSQRIRKNSRLLVLVGIAGIGKTALGERIAIEVSDYFQDDWSKFHQEPFDEEQPSSDFASVAARWLEKWGELITSDDRKDAQQLLYRLVKHLQENRYLIQIDSLENILEGDEEEGWNNFKDEWWVKFFECYFKANTCQSCIIITSQDLPDQLEEIGGCYENFWHIKPLSGLEKTEQISLFEKIGLKANSSSQDRLYLERVGEAYEGHPLALKVIAGEIKGNPFKGNILAYWNEYGKEIEEVENAIAESQEGKLIGADDKWKLDQFTKTLRKKVRSRLEKTFIRLKKDAKYSYILLCESSVYRCAVQKEFWLSHLEDWDRDKNEQSAALQILKDRYLVEELIENSSSRCLVRQHNLVRSVSLSHTQLLDQLTEDA